MSLFGALARVRAAEAEMALAREAVAAPAGALLLRGERHPLTTVGIAAGAGFVLGRLGVGAVRVPGLVSFLGGGLAELVAHGAQLIAAFGEGGLGDQLSTATATGDPSS